MGSRTHAGWLALLLMGCGRQVAPPTAPAAAEQLAEKAPYSVEAVDSGTGSVSTHMGQLNDALGQIASGLAQNGTPSTGPVGHYLRKKLRGRMKSGNLTFTRGDGGTSVTPAFLKIEALKIEGLKIEADVIELKTNAATKPQGGAGKTGQDQWSNQT